MTASPLPDLVALAKLTNKEWYAIPALGRLFDYCGNPIRGNTDSRGYYRVTTTWRGEDVQILFHRIMWIAQNGVPEDPELEIDHIDGNKANNTISNLRLVTHLENMHNPNTPPLCGEDHPQAKLTNAQAHAIREKYLESFGKPKSQRVTTRMLAAEYSAICGTKISHQQISRILRNEIYREVIGV